MKKLKKFKKFSQGGLGSSEGAEAANIDTNKTEFESGRGEKNLESIKNFFMGRRSKEEASAPIEERDTSSKSSESAKPEPAKAAPTKPEPAKTDKVETPKISRNSADDTAATSFDYPPQREQNPALDEAKEQGRRAAAAFKPAAPKTAKPAAISRDMEKGTSRGGGSYPINISTGASGFGDRNAKNKAEIERLKKEGSGAVESVEGPLEMAALGTVKGARMLYGAGKKAYDYTTKPAAKPAEKSEPKLDSKVEPKEAPKSGAIQPTGKGPSEAGRKAMEESKGSLKDQAKEAVNKQREADKDVRGPVSGAVKPTGAGPSEAGRKLMQQAGRGKPESLKERTMREINRQRELEKDPRGLLGGKSGTLSPLGQRTKNLIEKQREADKYPGDAGVDKVLERHDLPRKKGGKIPAFKKGGFVGRADGCAQRGKTKGRVV